MNTSKVDILNIGLIVLSAVLAYLFPLEVFVLAYAILGPLHYLTEINWLDKKNYFTLYPKKYWLALAITGTALIVLPKLFLYYFGTDDSMLTAICRWINSVSNGFIFALIILSFGYAFVKKTSIWIVLIAIALIGAIAFNSDDTYTILIGLFVPTIIHVYVFTLLFMLFGAKKSKSKLGYLSVAIALIVPFVFIGLSLEGHSYVFADSMKSIYLENGFHQTPTLFAKFIGISDGTTFFFYESMELKLMMFISFIYLYHYLNWFSKTTVIGWHKNITTARAITIIALWAVLLTLFYIDYRLGFLMALFFSFLHVILEFPLNLVSIKGIFNKD